MGEPTTKDLGKPLALHLYTVMARRQELILDLSQLGTHSLAGWFPPEHEARAASTYRPNSMSRVLSG